MQEVSRSLGLRISAFRRQGRSAQVQTQTPAGGCLWGLPGVAWHPESSAPLCQTRTAHCQHRLCPDIVTEASLSPAAQRGNCCQT